MIERLVVRALSARFPGLMAIAHCDIPCGIYDPGPTQLAAKTVLTMVKKIRELEIPGPNAGQRELEAYHASITRLVQVKEEHAQLCKKELLILWTDYFKEKHLAMFPNLHTQFWTAAKLCSWNKQNVDPKAAQDLVAAADQIATVFHQAEARAVPS